MTVLRTFLIHDERGAGLCVKKDAADLGGVMLWLRENGKYFRTTAQRAGEYDIRPSYRKIAKREL